MAIYLIRHAHAWSRGRWAGDDLLRPLSDRGSQQAERVMKVLADEPIQRIFSSPATRCIETVEPLADRLDLDIKVRDEFREAAEVGPALELLVRHAEKGVAACAHGDLIPPLVREMVAQGMRTKSQRIATKGSVWVIETDSKGRFTKGHYIPQT